MYQLGVYEKAMPNNLSFREKLEAAKETGYDFVELSVDETKEKLSRLDYNSYTRKTLIDDMKKAGISFRSMCLSGHRKYPLGSKDKFTRDESLNIMKKAIHLADDLGIRIIQLAGYDVYYEQSDSDTVKYFEENLQKSVDMASNYAIMLGFETMETEFMDTTEKAMKYVNKINSPYLNVYPDMGNLKNASLKYGFDIKDDLYTGKGHIIAAHLKDTIPNHFRNIGFFKGHVDFDYTIDLLWNLGIRRYVTEFWYLGEEDFKVQMFDTVKAFREKFEKYS